MFLNVLEHSSYVLIFFNVLIFLCLLVLEEIPFMPHKKCHCILISDLQHPLPLHTPSPSSMNSFQVFLVLVCINWCLTSSQVLVICWEFLPLTFWNTSCHCCQYNPLPLWLMPPQSKQETGSASHGILSKYINVEPDIPQVLAFC